MLSEGSFRYQKKRNIWSCIKLEYLPLVLSLIPFIRSCCSLKTIEVFSEGCIVDLGLEIIDGVLFFQLGIFNLFEQP